ncbi:DUF3471 domain-containing protein, partial [Soonwooa sp.]|uniref:DUF3471 domain-containing protein n=1 Tax=Soonwooa sp. TaxID=1938592 RepID=UPI0035B41078
NNEAKSYLQKNNEWKEEAETDMSSPLGAGGIESTPSDLVAFSNALFGGKLVSEKDIDFMKTIKDGIGNGLFQFPFYDFKGYGHNGGIDGFTSSFTHFDQDDVSFALTSNASNYNNNDIAIAVLSAVYNKEFDIPNLKAYQVKPEELNQYIGTYSSPQIPLKITISVKDNVLMAQATGQNAFPLDASEKDVFRFDKVGVVLEFKPTEKKMTLKQGGGEFSFMKE